MTPGTGPVELRSPSGLRVQVNRNGSIRRIDHGDVIVNLFLGSEVEGGPANLYLRRHAATVEWIALLGPSSPATIRCDERGLVARGEWQGIRFRAALADRGSMGKLPRVASERAFGESEGRSSSHLRWDGKTKP